MAYDEGLAERVRAMMKKKKGFSEKKMFGGICFFIYGNMTCGVDKSRLMLRVGPDQYEKVLKRKYAKPMDITGRPMKGIVFIDSEGMKTASSLNKWLDYALTFVQSLPKKKTISEVSK